MKDDSQFKESNAIWLQALINHRMSPEADLNISGDQFKAAMRNLPGGVTIVTTRHLNERRGLTVTATCSVSSEPQLLLACINGSSECSDFIIRSGAFAVNVLAEDHVALAKRFAGIDRIHGEERFALGEWTTGAIGSPLLSDAITSFDCVLHDVVQQGTHYVFFGRIKMIAGIRKAKSLTYKDREFSCL